MVPKYASGVWWSRWFDVNNEDLVKITDDYNTRKIPLDGTPTCVVSFASLRYSAPLKTVPWPFGPEYIDVESVAVNLPYSSVIRMRLLCASCVFGTRCSVLHNRCWFVCASLASLALQCL